MSTAAPGMKPLGTDADGRLLDELPCLQCGYLLRGRRMDEACPECGKPVVESARDDLLRYMPADWLTIVRRGVTMIIASGLSVVATFMLSVLSVIIGVAMQWGDGFGVIMLLVGIAGTVAPPLLLAVGAWQVTHRPDQPRLPKRAWLWRRLARAGTVAAMAAIALLWLTVAAFTSYSAPAEWIPLVWAVVLLVAGPVGFAVTLAYLGQLAMRLPSVAIARQCRWLALGTILAVGGTVGLQVLSFAFMYNAFNSGSPSQTTSPVAPPSTPTAPVSYTNTTTEPDGSINTYTSYDDGTFVDETKHPDGSRTVHTTDPQGVEFTIEYDAAGSITHSQSVTTPTGFGGSPWWPIMILSNLVQCAGWVLGLVICIWSLVLAFLWRGHLTRCLASVTPTVQPALLTAQYAESLMNARMPCSQDAKAEDVT